MCYHQKEEQIQICPPAVVIILKAGEGELKI